MVTKIAIRLGVEGGPELKRALDEAGTAGQSAFQRIDAAADQASAATDKLTDKARQAAQAAQSVRPPGATPAAPAPVPSAAPPAPTTARPPVPPVSPSPAALREAERVRYRLDTEARNAIQLQRDTAVIDRAAASGAYTEADATRLRELAERRYGGGSNDNDPARRGLDANVRQGLTYQGFDVFTTLSGGMSPALVAAQQGPQIFQTLADGAGVKENLAALGRSALGLVTPFTVATTAVAGLGTAFVVAASQAGTERDALEKSVQGIGRATGATVGQLEMLSRASAEASKTSTSATREIVAALASTGDISLPAIDSVSRSVSDFAKLTGTDIPTATATLATAFADPAKGADTLAKSIGGLDDRTRQLIRTQAEAGNTAGAQATLAESLDRTLKENVRSVEGLAAGWEAATTAAGRYWDRFKTRAGQVTGSAPETAEEALARLNLQVENTNRIRAFAGQDPLGLGSRIVRDRDAAQIIADTERREARAKAAELAAERASLTAGDLARSLDPMGTQLRAMEAQRAKLETGLATPLARSKLGDDLPKVEEAFARVTRQIADMKRDMAEFGTTAAAALNRNADFALKTVGYTPTGRAVAEAQRAYEDGVGKAQNDAEREALRDARDKTLERIRREALTSENLQGGAFARLSAEVQQQFLTAAQNPRYARIPVGIAAAITGPESGGNLDIGYSRSLGEDGRPSSAFGLGQITKGTAEDAIRRGYLPAGYDRMNRGTMAEGILGVLSMKLDDNGGDINRAIMAYRGSTSETVNRGYLAKVLRDSGQSGLPSEADLAREQDARTRALRIEAETLRITTEAAGRDRQGTLARIEAMRAEEEARGRGIVVTREFAAQIGREASERQRIIADGRFQQYAQDAAFQRDQLGRTTIEARGASVARSLGYDLDSPRGAAVMEAERLNESLRTTKQVAGEAFTGLLTDLRRGNDLMSSLDRISGTIADRFISGAVDSVVSAAFAGEGKGGGGWIGSVLASIKSGIGAADGRVPRYADGRTPSVSAAGIISGPGGPRDDSILAMVSNREAIIRASSVKRYGVDFIRSINEGTVPREIADFAQIDDQRRRLRRFADGSVPVRDAFTMPRDAARGMRPSGDSGLTVNIANNTPATVSAREVRDGRGQRRLEVTIDEGVARSLSQPGSKSAQVAGVKPPIARR